MNLKVTTNNDQEKSSWFPGHSIKRRGIYTNKTGGVLLVLLKNHCKMCLHYCAGEMSIRDISTLNDNYTLAPIGKSITITQTAKE